MCRALSYYGQPILLDELLYRPDNSLIKQSYDPKLMSFIQNLAGFGMALWDESSFHPREPYLYKTPTLPFFDVNLKHLAIKTRLNCLLAHVRGVGYSEEEMVTQQNVHPFIFPHHHLVLAHNGQLAKFSQMKFQLLRYVKPQIAAAIAGTTDSEWLLAVLLSQLKNEEDEFDPHAISEAILKTLDIIQQVRKKNKITISSPANLFITNGQCLMVTRFVFDYGRYPEGYDAAHLLYHSLWYTYGKKYGKYGDEYRMFEGEKKLSVIFCSEPLTEDMTTWIEVPEYSLAIAQPLADEVSIKITDIGI